ncbi:MAG: ABC transporter ATP-binding protein [Lachnospiraceae bacterium]|jgi:ABC-2 type transport system ATP-binding protein
MLEFKHVTKTYRGVTAVDDLSLALADGSVTALLGPNGSGKSTLMKIASGLTRPSSGEILLDGNPLSDRSKARIAYMPTEPYFYSYMTWKDAGSYYRDFFADFSEERYYSLLDQFHLDPKRKIAKLSSGMTAKGKIALTLARKADVILFDEPLNGVDIIARDQILEAIRAAHSPNQIFLISSHLVEAITPLCSDVSYVKKGHIVKSGKTGELEAAAGKNLAEIYRDLYGDIWEE